MVRHFMRKSLSVLLVLQLLTLLALRGLAQEPDPEEAREAAIIARFVTVLEKNPRRGTALDKVYGFHVERGTLDRLVQSYRNQAAQAQGSAAGPAWMIVGLVESLRGQDAVAVSAFQNAESADPANPLASYYLGQSLILVGQPAAAAEALERAIVRKPAQVDQLEIFQALGRVYQQARRNDKALEVWNRLEQQFPRDARVQEQIATTLLEEGQFEAALPRFQALARTTSDKSRQAQFLVEAAEIKVRLGQTSAALAEFEQLQSQLNPDNWLFRDVRRRLENIYLRTDDQAGLIQYYEAWLVKNPSDLVATARISQLLAGLGRTQEARDWLQKALKTAPSRSDLRRTLIAQLIQENDVPAALSQYEQLDRNEPGNPDTLREWGRLILKDAGRPEAVRKSDAVALWTRLTTARPRDPLAAAQVADLLRQAEFVDEAIGMYRKAIELAPDQSQYKEYLGEYFHILQRKDEALEIWRLIATGPARTAPNLARLAEVLAGFGYLAESIDANTEACRLDPRDINLQIKQVDLLVQAERNQEALAQLEIVRKLAATEEEREAWIQRELRTLQALDTLSARVESVRAELKTIPATPETAAARAGLWYWIARAHEAQRQLKDAAQAIGEARQLTPQSIPTLVATARIQEAQNNLLDAIEANTRLAIVDRRFRTDYLKKIAQLEVSLGRRDRALQAGRDLLAAAPGNPELYEFFSQLCFQLGETDEGLQTLRRSVRINPTETKGLLLLASALSDQFRSTEAIELYWRAFEKAADLENRLGVVPRLTELYLQTNQFDRLLERLERLRREPDQHREMTICLAQAYQSAGDDGKARLELEKLLTPETRDTQLLQQLGKICEQEGDLESALRFQQQLNTIAPSKEGTLRVAMLLMRSGSADEAAELLSRVTAEEKDPLQLLRSIDSLLVQGNFEQVSQITESLVRDQPRNWELLYRSGVALISIRPDDAANRFHALLALAVPDDDISLLVKSPLKAPGRRSSHVVQPGVQVPAILERFSAAYPIRQIAGLDGDSSYRPGMAGQAAAWSPTDFGVARIASLAWLNVLAAKNGKEKEFVEKYSARKDNPADPRGQMDWLYLAIARNDTVEQYRILKGLSLLPDADTSIKAAYLAHLSGRDANAQAVMNAETGEYEQKLTPLAAEELEHVLKCFRSLEGQSALISLGYSFRQLVALELKRAGRLDESLALQDEGFRNAKTPAEIGSALYQAVNQNQFEKSLELLDRLEKAVQGAAGGTNAMAAHSSHYATPEYESGMLGPLMSRRGESKAWNDVLGLWDRHVKSALRRIESPNPSQNGLKARQIQNSPGYVQIWRGVRNTHEQLEFPAPNDYYPMATLQLLRQLFVTFQSGDALPELLAHFQKNAENQSQTKAARNFWGMGWGYLVWWKGDKDDAVAILTRLHESLPANDDQTLELARLQESRGALVVALNLIDSVAAVDQQTLQKREIAALRLSVNTGNIERARQAAERLFGLRLDASLQIQLARQMHQLGMHEQAEAVLARAGRQAGNKTHVLVTLMQQYQSQGKNDVATEIAHQLLRRSTRTASQGRSSPRDESTERRAALQVLKRSGRLPTMIAKVEEQLKASPKSQKLLESLIEYYSAEGNDKKVAELSARYAEIRGDDPQFRFQLAMQLMQASKFAESIVHFKIAIQKDPRLLRNSSWEIQNAFERADKMDELAGLYDSLDLKIFRQTSYELSNLLDNLARREKSRDRAITLFKRAWQELPDQRAQLLSNLSSDVFWQIPEIYDYARATMIPTESTAAKVGPWQGFGNIHSWNDQGRMTTMLGRFLAIAAKTNKLDELAAEVEKQSEALKTWRAGVPLLAMINLRRGHVDEAKAVLAKLLPSMGSLSEVGYYTHWEIAQELAAHDSGVSLAIEYLEVAVKFPELMTGNEFPYTPGRLLVALYRQQGRNVEARRIILRAMQQPPDRSYNNPQYEAYRRISSSMSLGKELRSLGYHIDAIKLYQKTLSNDDDLAAANRYGGESIKRELQSGLQASLDNLSPESLPDLLTAMPDDESHPSLDLVTMIDSRDLEKIGMSSVMGKLMSNLISRPAMVPKLRESLAAARIQRPDDLGVLILEAKLAIATGDRPATTQMLKQIADVLDRQPLVTVDAKIASARSRDAARQQTALWLLARDCLRDKDLQSQGISLAERSLAAARQLADELSVLAILREWGQILLDQGDREGAEKRWTEMLELVIPAEQAPPKAEDRRTGAASEIRPLRPLTGFEQWIAPTLVGQAGAAPGSATLPGSSQSKKTPLKSAVSLAQFERASQIAVLAAQNGMHDLSLRAISQAFRSGPPIEAMTIVDPSSSGFPAGPISEQSSVVPMVESRIADVVAVWRRRQVPDTVIYETLKQIVLPESRPLEVFLYPRALSSTADQTPQSLSLLLVKVAVDARQQDDLRKAAELRLPQPLGELGARVLLAQLAIASGDTAAGHKAVEGLVDRLSRDSLQYSSELACHVAWPALDLPDPPAAAVNLLEKAVEHLASATQQGRGTGAEEPLRSLRYKLARYYFKHQDPINAKRHLDDYLNNLVSIYQRYSNDYGSIRRKAELLRIAGVYAWAGRTAEALESLGQYADLPVSRSQSHEGLGRAGGLVFAELARQPAAERYQQLKTWTMPSEARKSVRLVAGLSPADAAPDGFDPLRSGMARGPKVAQFLSTAELLVSAALEAGKLAELRAELEPLVAENVENAEFLGLLVGLALDEASTLPKLMTGLEKRRAAAAATTGRPVLADAVLAQAAMRSATGKPAGMQLNQLTLQQASKVQDHLFMAMLRREQASSQLGGERAHRIDRLSHAPGLKHWTASSLATARTISAGAPPAWWIAHEGLISHVCGPDQSHLYLKYPLTGTFELSCDAWYGGWAEANIGYAGLAFVGLNAGGDTSIFPIGNRPDADHRADPAEMPDRFNRVRLSVSPGRVRYYVNDALIHTETFKSNTAPWFFLHCDRVWQSCYRNLRITGQPEIPVEVALSDGESLLGWSTGFYDETQPARRAAATEDSGAFDWWSATGVIHGRRLSSTSLGPAGVRQSRLYYGRPLQDGDRIRYEFFYETGVGAVEVHPALDRLAMLLKPDGVCLHWMTDGQGSEDALAGLNADNELLDPQIQRAPVPLKSGAWNLAEIRLVDSTAEVRVNGVLVAVCPLELTNSRQFGFYHDKAGTAARIRGVVLTGDWPKSLSPELLGDLAAPVPGLTDDDRQHLGRVIDERFRAVGLDPFLLQTRALPPSDRYEALKAWVLPNVDHASLRLYGDTAPSDTLVSAPIQLAPVSLRDAPPSVSTGAADARRVRSGGELIAPALDLVAVARELGKLPELRVLVERLNPDSDAVRRGRLAMLVLIEIAAGDLDKAKLNLKDLTPPRSPGLPDTLPVHERWPELIAASEAVRIPGLRAGAIDLFEVLLDSTNRKNPGWDWEVKVRPARQRARFLLDQPEIPAALARSPRGQWAQSTQTRASTRGAGPVPRWSIRGAETLHLGGEGNDLLYFQSPLRGTFTVEAEISTFGWREGRLMYGAQWASPSYTLDHADLGTLQRNWAGPKFPKKLDSLGDWCRIRMAVTPGKVTYFANEVPFHEQTLAAPGDPWLAIHSFGHYAAATRSLTIHGQPEIPAVLNLSEADDLQGWWAEFYGDVLGGDDAIWKKSGAEIVGPRIVKWEGRSRESVLQYHRPLLEDGEITYEFFFSPKQSLVHPALGRLAILLDASGLKLHWMTDSQYERTGLKPDHVLSDSFAATNLALKPDAWNAVALRVAGDTLTLQVNGQKVLERPIEVDNSRTFGFFRYAGDSEARIRNVVYRGDWPRILPSIKDQEFAVDHQALASFRPDELPYHYRWNFQGPVPQHLRPMGVVSEVISREPSSNGLKLSRTPSPLPEAQAIGFQWSDVVMGGDFEVTLGYRDFQSTTQVDNHLAPRIEILMAVGGPYGQHAQSVSLVHQRPQSSAMHISALHGVRKNAAEEDWHVADKAAAANAGRIRIVRRNGVLYFLMAAVDSDTWQLVDHRAVGTQDLRELIIGARCQDPAGTLSVVLTEFSVRARTLTYQHRFSQEELPGKFAWNFRDSMPAGLQQWAPKPPNEFRVAPDGVTIVRPGIEGQSGSPVGYNWQGLLRGDFEITLDYRDFESTTDKTDWQIPRIEIHVPIGGRDNTPANTHTATIGHRRRKDGTAVITSGVGVLQPNGQKAWTTSAEHKTERTSGRLRLMRVGTMISALAAPPGSDEFVLIGSRAAVESDIHSMSFAIRSESKISNATMTLTGVTIRARELKTGVDLAGAAVPIPGPAPFADGALPVEWHWDFQGPRPSFLIDWSKRQLNELRERPEGREVVRAAGVDSAEAAVGFQLARGLTGDFEVTLDYRDFQSTRVLTDWRVPRVDMSANFVIDEKSSKTSHSAGVSHRRNHDGALKLLATQGERGSDDTMNYRTTEVSTTRDGGRLRLVRQGGWIYYQSAPPDSGEWTTLQRLPLVSGPLRHLSVGLRAEDLQASGQVVLTRLSVRAAQSP